MVHKYHGVPYDFMKIIQLKKTVFQARVQQTYLLLDLMG